MSKRDSNQRILAIDPTPKGFGFVVMEGEKDLIDWGTRETRGPDRNAHSLGQAEGLMRSYEPDCVLVEDWTAKGARRRGRIPAFFRALSDLATKRGADCRKIPKEAILAAFGMERLLNKRKMAEAAARLLPDLACNLPPVRKPWMSEDVRTSIFDAAALALAFTHQH